MAMIEQIAAWTDSHSCDWSDIVLERARYGIADTIGCIIAAAKDPVVQSTSSAFFRSSDGKALNVANGQHCSAQIAAMVNGTAAHILEIDDNFYPALTHASAQAVPALLALAHEHGNTGQDLLDAYVLSLQLQAALASAQERHHVLAGWHATGTIAMIATAAAGAKMLGLGEAKIGHATSIACSMAAGTKAQFGSMTKSLHCGLAAKNSVSAVELAAAGIEGNSDALDGSLGFLSIYNGGVDPKYTKVEAFLKGPNALEKFGLAPKRHACCGSAHKGLDAAADLKNQYGFSMEQVKNIEVFVGTGNKQNLQYDRPKDGLEARFSMPYAMVVFLLTDRFWLDDLEDTAITRPEIVAHLDKVKLRLLNVDDANVPIDQPVEHQVRITLNSGQQLNASRAFAKGTIADPFSDDEYRSKFLDCCGVQVGENKASSLWAKLRELDLQSSTSDLLLS